MTTPTITDEERARAEREVATAGKRLNRARDNLARSMTAALDVAATAIADKAISERSAADLLGVDRNTIRKHIGKDPRAVTPPGIIAAQEQRAAGINTR